MNKIKPLIANANSVFSSEQIKTFNEAVTKAEVFITEKFNLDYEINLLLTTPSFLVSTIKEDNIGGRTFSSNIIAITFEPKEQVSENTIYETICHELGHSIRWAKVKEYTYTLFDNIIFEGLATVLEEVSTTGNKNIQFFLKEIQKTPQSEIDLIRKQLEKHYDDENFDYEKIFFTGDNNFPRWSAYKLGYFLVKKYLKDNNKNIFEATLESYKKFR